MPELYNQIADIGRQLGAARIVLYGSRARGDNRPRSDIDLAVYGLPETRRGAFWDAVEELPTLLKFDVAYILPGTDADFLKNIEKDGITLYEEGR